MKPLTEEQAIEIARQAVDGTFSPDELARIEVSLEDNRYVVKFVLALPPLTVGSGFVQVTLDADSGAVLERLRDAD
ncbi:peptidase propeptide and YPEB domain protein [Geobacter sp. OR-1]|uniref:PepSY domain-containing protein n=1 Tax=Geobacter sp. OR-1 TaxID=1266765 RepID=UPI000541D412|nr:PepSY domain-containing protein [Geobacter sp. OR-1]GAM10187.1 peptidase propeptide and YPEB domain protein [Geobacter sp. OR-1]